MIKMDPEVEGRANVVPPLTQTVLAQPVTATALKWIFKKV